MYYLVVINLLILELTFPSIKCFNVASENSTSNYYYTTDIFPRLFDRAEFPANGIKPMLNRKVFKGRRVSIREHPYIASIRRNVAHYLVGCILTKNIVLTVAYPLVDVSIAELSVVVGENYADRGSTLLTVIIVVVHEDFDAWTLQNDIAMLRMFEDITYKGSAKSINLIRGKDTLSSRKAFVTGWGRCDRTGKELCLPRSSRYTPAEKFDPMLRTITFTIKENYRYCRKYQTSDLPLPPGMICLGIAREDNPVTECLGVPGAPLVVGARLSAILSWGFGCSHYKDLPLIYTNIQYYQPWITHNIQIFRSLSKVYLLKLFQAKRAYIFKEWLTLTRIIPPNYSFETDMQMAILRVDKQLAKLFGDVYDIRDYLYNGIHHKFKTKMYAKLRETTALAEERKLNQNNTSFYFMKLNETLEPFFKEHSDLDSSITDTGETAEEDDSIEEYVE